MINNFESEYWDKTHLDCDKQLDEVDGIDGPFQDMYVKSLCFAKLLLADKPYACVEREYIGAVHDIEDSVKSFDDLSDGLWAGYHPIVLLFSRLRWYGEKALYHYSDSDVLIKSNALIGEIKQARKFNALLPAEWSRSQVQNVEDKNVFEKILLSAEARYAFDTGKELNLDQITVLSGMSKRAVQNDVAKNSDKNLKVTGDMVTNINARAWLKERRNFIPTKYYHSDEEEGAALNLDVKVLEKDTEFVFVPVAEDGTVFLPELRQPQGYLIGKYGCETHVENYFDAINQLQVMVSPRFRRPNDEGNWGIKAVDSWKRIPLSDLSSF